jgi:hypothetical protein
MKKNCFVKEKPEKRKHLSQCQSAGKTPKGTRNKRRGCAGAMCLCRTFWFAGGGHYLRFRLFPVDLTKWKKPYVVVANRELIE